MFGNFLVRDRVRGILEAVVPDACTFHPTIERKSKKPAPWSLAVPKHNLPTFFPKPAPPFCSKCQEPKIWFSAMGPFWDQMRSFDSHGIDAFKTLEWYGPRTREDNFESTNAYRKQIGLPSLPWSRWRITPPPHAERWTRGGVRRDLYFSVRLEQLLKRLKIKGQLVRLATFSDVKTTPDDEAWIEDKLELLAKNGLADLPKPTAGATGNATQKWFKRFLGRKAQKQAQAFDFAEIEKKQKLKLPQDYKDFLTKIGPMSFEDVMEMEGFTASILPPAKLDFKDYRRGCVPELDEEQSQIDGVMFAETEHGDAFVFDVSAEGDDYPVFWHDHEQNTLEPFAPNFAECIKRFAERT